MKGTWSEHTLARHKLDVFQPLGPIRRVILYLHCLAGDTLRRNAVFTELFDTHNLVCVSPHGGPCWWADRPCPDFDAEITPEAYLLERVLPFLQEQWNLPMRSLGLLGISMGGQAALRLGFKYPERFPSVAAIAPAIDYHELYGEALPLDQLYPSKEHCRQDTAPMHLHPTLFPANLFLCTDPEDSWFRGGDRLHEKLKALGIAHEWVNDVSLGGHSWAYFQAMAPRAVQFLLNATEQEPLRLL